MGSFNKIKKAIHRVIRYIRYRRRVYGTVGIENKFMKGCFILECAKIGNYNHIGSYTMINNASIGNYCSIAPGVKIGQANHDLNCFSTNSRFCEGRNGFKMYSTPSVIENDVWIGANAIVLQGVKIGNGAVVGAGAVVTKDVPEYTIVVGIPARPLRKRLYEEMIKKLKRNLWWDKKPKEVIKMNF